LDADETFDHWLTLGVDLDLSYGAFDGDKLVAFTLHAPRGDELYNFATGVIPEYRGQGLVARLYEKITPSVTLEVLKSNEIAKRAYTRAGFHQTRELVTLTGTFGRGASIKRGHNYQIKPFLGDASLTISPLWIPAFENNRTTLSRKPLTHEIHELRNGANLLAYAIYTPSEGLVRELGAITTPHLDQLFGCMRFPGETVVIGAVDTRAKSLLDYLASRHLQVYAEQCELRRNAIIA
jgi:GNAT superfamily N-acetyltransferase